jgi:phosphatidylglycerophosphatase A
VSLARVLATWFGCGYSRFAPGTVGTLGALPLVYALHTLGIVPYWIATALVTALGVWASGKVATELGKDDPQEVVIDEVAGVLIAVGLASGLEFHANLAAAVVAVLLFRLFDIWKPGPIDSVQSLHGGFGVMADDVLAGVAAGLVANGVSGFWVG